MREFPVRTTSPGTFLQSARVKQTSKSFCRTKLRGHVKFIKARYLNAGAARLPFAMQLHAIMVRCAEWSSCTAELRASMTALLISLLPALPLKLPQQRAWAAACCVTALQLCSQQKGQGRHTASFLPTDFFKMPRPESAN